MIIRVIGEPAPQGSKRHVGHGGLIESSKKVKPWRQDVVAAALEQIPREERGLDGAIVVEMHFRLRAPASASKKRLALGPNTRPDLSKLVRASEDALTDAGIWVDDGRVVSCLATKQFADATEATGCDILIRLQGDAP